jgi:hypothetical protein
MASKKKPAARMIPPAQPAKPAPVERTAAPSTAPKNRPAAASTPAEGARGGGRTGTAKPGPPAANAKPGASKPAVGAVRPVASERRSTPPAAAARPERQRRRGVARASAPAEPLRETTLEDEGGPLPVPGLEEEDQIRAAKYLPRELPKRLFEEERFLFPETYGVNRIRLLVRDPEWIFAYWDVNAEAMKELGRSLGERALALSRLTLRVVDPVSNSSTDILLPPGARWWYVRTDSARRTYRAELGVTLPSGEFRRIAESNTVVTPRVGPSAERARRRMSYPESREIPLSAADAASEAEKRAGVTRKPWAKGAVEGAPEPNGTETEKTRGEKGGASDTFRSGASDAFRR